jgi:hypothetical protein
MVRTAVAFAIAVTLLLGACEERTEDTETGGDPAITLVLVGDVGLNISRAPVEADGFHVPDSDRVYSWQELTAGIAPLLARLENACRVLTRAEIYPKPLYGRSPLD